MWSFKEPFFWHCSNREPAGDPPRRVCVGVEPWEDGETIRCLITRGGFVTRIRSGESAVVARGELAPVASSMTLEILGFGPGHTDS